MQNEIVARAIIRKSDILFSTGFIHIKGDLIEGLFSTDYLKICLDKERIIAYLSERKLFENDSGKFYLKSIQTIFQAKYDYDYIYVPDDYVLNDEAGNSLSLSILEPVESQKFSFILEEFEKFRF